MSPKRTNIIKIYFSDFFDISPELLEEYGAFNISLINDLPLFIDPFLLFNSKNPVYQQLHEGIIRYLRFLRDKSRSVEITDGLLKSWYLFSEVKQSWVGFSRVGNNGSGLGTDFARSLNGNLNSIFVTFGQERITKGSHLEKLCLISDGVGRDNISDFTTNLIKEFLLNYTQTFSRAYLRPEFRRVVLVEKVRFNYETESWERDRYELPYFYGDYVLLTPKDILTRDDIWISREDLFKQFQNVAFALPDEALRAQVNNYFMLRLSAKPTRKEIHDLTTWILHEYPQLLEYYIRTKEDSGDSAVAISSDKVQETETLFIDQVNRFVNELVTSTRFYEYTGNTLEEARARILFLKDVIENKDGYKVFYLKGKPIQRESDLQILYRLTWYGSSSDVNREVNNGRGPVDFKISRGNEDKSLVEFKLASNPQLEKNLGNQVGIYEKANNTMKSIKVILYFSSQELERVRSILKKLMVDGDANIILIDGRADNKPSASKA